MKLVNPSDDQLNAAFAKHVAGWHLGKSRKEYKDYWYAADVSIAHTSKIAPAYTIDAVLLFQFLETGSFYCKRNYFMASTETPDLWFVHFCRWDARERKQCEGKAYSERFPLACVIALLIAHGIQVEFTK